MHSRIWNGTLFNRYCPVSHAWVKRVDGRMVLNSIFWILRSGAPWRDLPDCFGPNTTCYNRFIRWQRAGVWDCILGAISNQQDTDIQMIDSSIIRVHQHGAYIKQSVDWRTAARQSYRNRVDERSSNKRHVSRRDNL